MLENVTACHSPIAPPVPLHHLLHLSTSYSHLQILLQQKHNQDEDPAAAATKRAKGKWFPREKKESSNPRLPKVLPFLLQRYNVHRGTGVTSRLTVPASKWYHKLKKVRRWEHTLCGATMRANWQPHPITPLSPDQAGCQRLAGGTRTHSPRCSLITILAPCWPHCRWFWRRPIT